MKRLALQCAHLAPQRVRSLIVAAPAAARRCSSSASSASRAARFSGEPALQRISSGRDRRRAVLSADDCLPDARDLGIAGQVRSPPPRRCSCARGCRTVMSNSATPADTCRRSSSSTHSTRTPRLFSPRSGATENPAALARTGQNESAAIRKPDGGASSDRVAIKKIVKRNACPWQAWQRPTLPGLEP